MSNPMDNRQKDGQPFASREEVTEAMKDDRYRVQKSEDYIQRVQARLAVTDFEGLTGVSINGPQFPLTDGRPDDEQWQNLGDGTFKDMHDAMQYFRSPLYKLSPAFRASVADAVQRSMPGQGEAVDTALRVTFDGSDGSGRGDNDPSNSPAGA